MLSAMAAAKDSASLANRPSCVGGKREPIPTENEEYKFDYDTERGVYKRILPMKIGAFVVTRYLSTHLSFNINRDQTQLPIGQGNR
jgi:hypothetical protein